MSLTEEIHIQNLALLLAWEACDEEPSMPMFLQSYGDFERKRELGRGRVKERGCQRQRLVTSFRKKSWEVPHRVHDKFLSDGPFDKFEGDDLEGQDRKSVV